MSNSFRLVETHFRQADSLALMLKMLADFCR
jgi:hypothetical protein